MILAVANVFGTIILIAFFIYYFRKYLLIPLRESSSANITFAVVAVVVVSFGYAYFASYYRVSAREMKRLDSSLRSLLYSHFAETLSGLATIRAYGETKRFIKDDEYFIDLENRALFLTITNQVRFTFSSCLRLSTSSVLGVLVCWRLTY